jgi:hypothetical protein
MTAFYNRYRVLAFEVELVVSDPSADGIVVAATVQPSTEVFTIVGKDIETMSEQPNTAVGYLNNTGSQRITMRRRFTVPEIEGLRPNEFAGALSLYSSDVASNPSSTPYLRIAAAGLSGSPTVTVAINIVAHAELYARKVLGQS